MNERTARAIVTVCVFEDGDSWELGILCEDMDPWSTLGLLRAAFQRQRDYVESLEFEAVADVDDDD